MKLFYHSKCGIWFHNQKHPLTFGGEKRNLTTSFDITHDFSFDFQLKDQHVGPLIGIMTSPKNQTSLAGNLNLFRDIQEELLSRDALSYVFSYMDVKADGNVIGYIYLPSEEKWLKANMPLPDIVYNRVPFRKAENSLQFQNCLELFKNYNIPLFNPGFIDKYSLFLLLKMNENILKYIPDTALIDSSITLDRFFHKHRDIYLKPRLQSKGTNIFRLHSNLILESNSDNEIREFFTFEDLWNKYADIFKDGSYIAQRTVHPHIMNGRRYDFRILAHWSEDVGRHIVTGVGIRAANVNKLTTHVTYGGEIFPYKTIQCFRHDEFISIAVREIGKLLCDTIGFFGEFSIDAGMDADENYVIYEVNSKPMSFDEMEIEEARIKNLCDIFLQKTGF